MCTTESAAIPDFSHLHGHTKWSRGDSTNSPAELVRKAFLDGQKAIAVTDHGVASSWIQMYKACKQVTEEAQAAERKRLEEAGLPVDEAAISQIGIKFIPGVEMYETDDRTIMSKALMEEYGFSTHHFILLPKNNEGLKNLNRIISDASLNGQFSGRNRTDMRIIRENNWGEGIIATTACLASRTSQLILKGDIAGAERFAHECSLTFDEFYLELQDNNIKDQYIVNEGLKQIAENTGLPLVFTQDYHYLDAGDDDLHDTWICIGRKQDKHEVGRQGYDGGPYHFATKAEMYKSVEQGLIPLEAYTNTMVIADKCNVTFDLKRNRFPKFPFIPKGHTADSYLRELTLSGLWTYLLERNQQQIEAIDASVYLKRLDYELKVISDKGYSDYFLILNDLMKFCADSNIHTGPARGSAAGSLVAYLTAITDVDAVEHELLFERFLNPERMSAPDVDIDFEDERRHEVFSYLQRRYGKAHVAKIITYGTSKLRSGIDDLCRTLEEKDEDGNTVTFGLELAAEIKKNIPVKMPDQTDPSLRIMRKLATDPESFREAYRDRTDAMHNMAVKFMADMKANPKIEEGLEFMDGLIRSFGQHAAAVVITDEPITDHVPVYRLNKEDELPVTAFSMKEIDDELQMLKIDVLGLSTMTIVRYAEENINKTNFSGEPFNIRKIRLDDEETFKTVRDGHTNGIFQISGGPITGYTKRVRPWKFNDLVDILGIFRPGPLEALVDKTTTMAEKYIINADDQQLMRFTQEIPENLRPIYTKSRGILIYQEQILALAQQMAGYTMGGADILRRGIGKKDIALLQSLKAEFVYGTAKGIPVVQQKVDELELTPDEQQDTDFHKKLNTFKKQLASMKATLALGKPVAGCVANGYDEEYSLTTFDAIQRFSGYSFNRSHSVGYGILAYRTAYMKTHYPVEFMAAQLTVQGDDEDKTIANVQECRRLNILILPPDINKSRAGFNIEFVEEKDENGVATGKMVKAIRFGISSIKGIGGKVVEEVLDRPELKEEEPKLTVEEIDARLAKMAEGFVGGASNKAASRSKLEGDTLMDEENIIVRQKTPFANFDDFYHRVDKRIINKSKLEVLIKAGCFDFDNPNRFELLNHFFFDLRKDKPYEGKESAYLKEKAFKKAKLTQVFRLDEGKYDVDVLSEYEKEFFGFYLSHHPYQDLPYAPWHEVQDGQSVDMGGKIKKIKKIKTKKKDDMCFITLETAGGVMDVTVFPNQFKEYQAEIFTGNIAIFRGKKQTQDNDKSSMILDKMLKVRKKKFKVEKPEEEIVPVAAAAPVSPPPPPVTMRPDPMADLYTRAPDPTPVPKPVPEPVPLAQASPQSFDLASLFGN